MQQPFNRERYRQSGCACAFTKQRIFLFDDEYGHEKEMARLGLDGYGEICQHACF